MAVRRAGAPYFGSRWRASRRSLYSFNANNGTDGVGPNAGLIQGSGNDDNFYGTTFAGGVNNVGTVFKITPGGNRDGPAFLWSGRWQFASGGSYRGNRWQPVWHDAGWRHRRTWNGLPNDHGRRTGLAIFVHRATKSTRRMSITSNDDGAYPMGGLIQGSDGNFYGTTRSGGEFFVGTVFRITPARHRLANDLLRQASNPCSTLIDGSLPLAGLVEGTDGSLCRHHRGGKAPASSGTVFGLTHALAPP